MPNLAMLFECHGQEVHLQLTQQSTTQLAIKKIKLDLPCAFLECQLSRALLRQLQMHLLLPLPPLQSHEYTSLEHVCVALQARCSNLLSRQNVQPRG